MQFFDVLNVYLSNKHLLGTGLADYNYIDQ